MELAQIGLMKKAGAVAFSDDGMPVENSNIMALALEYAVSHNTIIISHCEDKNISCNGVVNQGVNATIAGLRAISPAAEQVMIARDIILAKNKHAPVHIAHVSTHESVQLIRQAKQQGVMVTCETCPHYFSISDDAILTYDTNAKINPPLRSKDDVNAIIEGIKDNTIDAIATDHAPHSQDEKKQEFDIAPFGTIGFETAFSVAYTYLVKQGHISLLKLSELMTKKPASILGFDRGIIKEGVKANFAVVSLDERYIVDAANMSSKSSNSVFNGYELQGKVKMTCVDGCFHKF
jgi:dihydroorotase